MTNYVDGTVIIITGAGSGFGKLVAQMTADLGEKVIGADINEENLKGVVNGITAVYDQMIAQGEGQVVNISSIYGNYGIPGSGVYSATKAAVKVISDSLRVEAQGKIKVTTLKPTGIPGTNLASAIVNEEAVLGLTAHNYARYGENMVVYVNDELPAAQSDPNSVKYWTVTPEELAQNVVYVINQPWGVNISDITVRATGEDYVY